jgi:hypothetical protein
MTAFVEPLQSSPYSFKTAPPETDRKTRLLNLRRLDQLFSG